MTVSPRFACRVWKLSRKVRLDVSPETSRAVSCGLAGVAAGACVVATGAAVRNWDVVRLGCSLTLGSALGAAAALGLLRSPAPELVPAQA
jgi:hypothetical protein